MNEAVKAAQIDQWLSEQAQALMPYFIGLLSLSAEEGLEDASVLGSGTLICVGKVFGILTADHVIEQLPSSGEIGLLKIRGSKREFQGQRLNLDHTASIIV